MHTEQEGWKQAGSIPIQDPSSWMDQQQEQARSGAGAGHCCQLHAAGEEDMGRDTGDKCLREDSSDKGKLWMR